MVMLVKVEIVRLKTTFPGISAGEHGKQMYYIHYLYTNSINNLPNPLVTTDKNEQKTPMPASFCAAITNVYFVQGSSPMIWLLPSGSSAIKAVPLSGVYLMTWPKIGPFWLKHGSSSYVRVTDALSTDTTVEPVGADAGATIKLCRRYMSLHEVHAFHNNSMQGTYMYIHTNRLY